MRRRLTHAGVALVLSALALPAGAAGLVVVCQTGAEVQVVDPDAGAVTHRIPVAKAPAGIALSPDGAHAYITHPDAGLLTRLDLARGRAGEPVAIGGQPFGVVADPDGRRLYVSDWSASRVRWLDAATLAETGTVEVGRAPAGLALDARRRELYSADREAGAVSIIDLDTFARVATVPVGEGPYAFDDAGDAPVLRVANVRSGDLTEMDKATRATTRIKVGKMPYGVASAPGAGPALVANQQSGTLSLVASGGARDVRTLRVGGSPEAVLLDPEQPRAFVTDWFSDQILVVDMADFRLERRIGVCKGPRALARVP